jgi:hypothetical protein
MTDLENFEAALLRYDEAFCAWLELPCGTERSRMATGKVEEARSAYLAAKAAWEKERTAPAPRPTA